MISRNAVGLSTRVRIPEMLVRVNASVFLFYRFKRTYAEAVETIQRHLQKRRGVTDEHCTQLLGYTYKIRNREGTPCLSLGYARVKRQRIFSKAWPQNKNK